MGAPKQTLLRRRIEQGGQGRPEAARTLPVGEALTARSVVLHTMECEARQGFVVVPS